MSILITSYVNLEFKHKVHLMLLGRKKCKCIIPKYSEKSLSSITLCQQLLSKNSRILEKKDAIK